MHCSVITAHLWMVRLWMNIIFFSKSFSIFQISHNQCVQLFIRKKHFEKEEIKLVTMWKKFITHLSSEVFLIRIHFFCSCFLPLHLAAASSLLSFQLKLFSTEKTCLPPKARLGVHVWHSQPLGVSPTTWYTYMCGLDGHLSHQNVNPHRACIILTLSTAASQAHWSLHKCCWNDQLYL